MTIVLVKLDGQVYALDDRCPHQGGPLSKGTLNDDKLMCPWHCWSFDVRTGRSWCDPERMRLMNYAVSVEPGAMLVEGPYVAETFPVAVEDDYVVVETK